MKAIGTEKIELLHIDDEVAKMINNKYNDKYSLDFVKTRMAQGIKHFIDRGVPFDKAIELYQKTSKLLTFNPDSLELKLAVFDFLGISDRYVTHPADLIQSANLTYSRGMFLKEVKGLVLVNDIFQKSTTFNKKYGNQENSVLCQIVLVNNKFDK